MVQGSEPLGKPQGHGWDLLSSSPWPPRREQQDNPLGAPAASWKAGPKPRQGVQLARPKADSCSHRESALALVHSLPQAPMQPVALRLHSASEAQGSTELPRTIQAEAGTKPQPGCSHRRQQQHPLSTVKDAPGQSSTSTWGGNASAPGRAPPSTYSRAPPSQGQGCCSPSAGKSRGTQAWSV